MALKKWNVEVFGDVSSKLKAAKDEVNNLDLIVEVRDLVKVEKVKTREVISEAWRLSRVSKWMWLQKARLEWSYKGDKNTRYLSWQPIDKVGMVLIPSLLGNRLMRIH